MWMKSNKVKLNKFERLMEAGGGRVRWIKCQVPSGLGFAFVNSEQIPLVHIQFLAPANYGEVYLMREVPILR
jgi:hypothetical protein